MTQDKLLLASRKVPHKRGWVAISRRAQLTRSGAKSLKSALAAAVLPTMLSVLGILGAVDASAVQVDGTLSDSSDHAYSGEPFYFQYTVTPDRYAENAYLPVACYGGGDSWYTYGWGTQQYAGGHRNVPGDPAFLEISEGVIRWEVNVPSTLQGECYADLFVKVGTNHVKLAEVEFEVN